MVLWAKAKELEVEIGPEWTLSDGNLLSFHDLSRHPWNYFCDVGTHETFDTSEWADSDDPNRQRQFVRLLNQALKQRLNEWNIRKRTRASRASTANRSAPSPNSTSSPSTKIWCWSGPLI
jgi:hypothetical protein